MGRPKKQLEIPEPDQPVKLVDDQQTDQPDEQLVDDQQTDNLPFNENLPFIHPDLKATLETHPHINCVWLNDNGDWYFCDRPGFKAYSREQILNW